MMISIDSNAGRIPAVLGLGLVALGGQCAPALAIPSPELIVSSVTGLSQLWGLAALALGGSSVALAMTGSAHALKRWRQIALVAGVGCLGALSALAWLWITTHEARTAHLEATLTRPSPKSADGKSLDPTLFEFSYKIQLASTQGISTAAAAAELAALERGEAPDLIALDVRETAESEMGGVAGARAIRFPDLATSGIDFTGKRVLLFCHNGNRSGETCLALKARGIDCQFMVGGYEKWLVEGRSLAGSGARTLSDFRALTPFPNQKTLLDTAEVKGLIAQRRAILVDVRYPGEFAHSHVAGALSLPLRGMPTPELEQGFAQLPPGPVIAPCYDRRSCFFAEVLGRELTRRGREFLGRYTVPWEYFVAPPRPPHLAAWIERANRSTWTKIVEALTEAARPYSAAWGLGGFILTLALASRILVAPFAWKGDRDQRVLRELRAETAAVKAELASDPVRLSRALRDQMRSHGLTPGRNALALLFLPVLALGIEVVIGLAKGQPAGFLWLADLATPDPQLVLPFAFSIMISLYLALALSDRGWQRIAIGVVGVPTITLLTMSLPAAATLYMSVSAVLLLAQRWVSSWRWAWLAGVAQRVGRWWTTPRVREPDVVALWDAAVLPEVGNKAHRLAVLAQQGFSVPKGIVLTQPFLLRWAGRDAAWRKAASAKFSRALGRRRVLAVRSSAGKEDGAAGSFAGVFTTQINVQGCALAGAIDQVLGSFSDPSALAYASDVGSANILIQPMVEARFAGVLFTRDPATPGCCLIEWVEGFGEALVSGQASPKQARFGLLTGELIGAAASDAPIDLPKLVVLGRRIEALFGAPQDIEWAHDGRQFWILQSRNIVAPLAAISPEMKEWQRLCAMAQAQAAAVPFAPDDALLGMDEMAELLPTPTPASLGLLEAVSASGGSLDLAARSLGGRIAFTGHNGLTAPASLYVSAFGTLRTNHHVKATRVLTLSALAAQRLRRAARDIEAQVRNDVLPEIEARTALLLAVDFGVLATHDLLAALAQAQDQWVKRTRVAVDRVNIAAQFYLDEARVLLASHGQDTAVVLAATAPTALQLSLRAVALARPGDQCGLLRAALGHRASVDYELAAPRYGEDWPQLLAAYQGMLPTGERADYQPGDAELPPRVQAAVDRARRFQTLKEDAKHHGLRDLAVLRRILLALDGRFDLEGTIFWLSLDDIATLSTCTQPNLNALAKDRQAMARALAEAPQPAATLRARDIELGPLAGTLGEAARRMELAGQLAGQRVAGSGTAEGRAVRVSADDCSNGQPISGFHDGDIIVARTFHPAWLPELMRCGGVVVEVGGWLSHTAIMARERGIAMCVGVSNLDQIETGMWLRLSPNGAVAALQSPRVSCQEGSVYRLD